MKYLFTGLSVAQSAIMALLLLAFIAVITYVAYRIIKYGWEVTAELFNEYLEAKAEEADYKEEWREMKKIIKDCQENEGWTQYGQ